MTWFLIKRVLSLFPLLVGVSIVVFLMIKLVPGDPVAMMLGENSPASVQEREQMRKELGLDKPIYAQYWNYFKGLIRGDLGDSIRSQRSVQSIIQARLPSTIELTAAGLLIAVVLGMGLGLVGALNQNSWVDNVSVFLSLLGISVPSFWLGLLLMLVFAVDLKWLPVLGYGSLTALILPAFTLGFWVSGSISRFTRSGVLEVIHQDYVRTAHSKGLPHRRVVYRHVLRNALIPVITVVGIRFGQILAGTVIIETVFARPGLGLTLVNAIIYKDFPLTQGIVLFVASAYILVNFVVEATYMLLDPRVKYV